MTETLVGLMQDRPLQISAIIRHGARYNGKREIVSRAADGAISRYGFREAEVRARRLAKGLERLGVRRSDRVASLAWNTHRHLEMFYGVPGMGAVLHTINPRLWEEQLVYIAGHAEDRVLMFDPDLLDLVTRLAPRMPSVETYVMLGPQEALPRDCPLNLVAYEDLLADEDYDWPEFDERTASILCYTSGTTGMPKGVLSSHRSVVLHALAAQGATAFGLTPHETVLLVVPMFHAYGWSLPFIAAIAGAKLVLPGAAPQPDLIVDLIHEEGATLAMGVPTVWTGVFANLDATGRDLGPLKRALIGGSAMPPAMSRRLREEYGVEPITGWGMTEMSPLGSFSSTTPEIDALPELERQRRFDGQAGRILFPVEVKTVDAKGEDVPQDGETSGDIWVRGPCIAAGYFKGEGGKMLDAEGWFPTGDVGAVDEDGAIAITDRVKDLIKSGGEWISSTDIERAAVECPGVTQAAAIAAAHPKWQERPLLLVTTAHGVVVDTAAVLTTVQVGALAIAGRRCDDQRTTAHSNRQNRQESAARALSQLSDRARDAC
jgi:acyl-CoA synthetase (AMP-forming)/AMP-acid ligase II